MPGDMRQAARRGSRLRPSLPRPGLLERPAGRRSVSPTARRIRPLAFAARTLTSSGAFRGSPRARDASGDISAGPPAAALYAAAVKPFASSEAMEGREPPGSAFRLSSSQPPEAAQLSGSIRSST